MQMSYKPACLDWKHETQGCASYIGTTLKTPLAIGKKYTVSFWVNIPTPVDADYPDHIGMSLYREKIQNLKGAMFTQDEFKIDTVTYNEWYKVSWHIQPTCELTYLVMGVFKGATGPKVHNKNLAFNYYFIDKIEVKEMGGTNKKPVKKVVTFCKSTFIENSSALSVEIPGVTGYFDSGSEALSQTFKTELDDFAKRIKKNPTATFSISGHTDDTGDNHSALSLERINSSLSYLEKEHKISKLKFVYIIKGTDQPLSADNTTQGKALNRRVEIRQTSYEAADVIYRNLLLALFDNNLKEAFKALNIWLHIADHKDKILMLNDPRISVLQQGKYWKGIVNKVKKSYQKLYKGDERPFHLDALWCKDQKYRTLKFYIENLNAYVVETDKDDKRWDVSFSKELGTEEQDNLPALIDIISPNYWVKSSMVGERAAKANFFIIQHLEDTTVLTQYLPLLKERCEAGEAKWLYFAMMYDRLQVYKNLPQRYGTQFRNEEGKQEMFPLEDVLKVNEWRGAIGLDSLGI